MPAGLDRCPLDLAPSDDVAGTPLVDPDRARTAAGHTGPRRCQDGVEGQPVGRDGRERLTETLEDRPCGLGVERKRDLEDRFPALQASCIGRAQDLDVHQPVPDLDVVPARREQVELLALLDGCRRHRIERRIGARDGAGEGAPLPARDDLGHTPRALLPGRREHVITRMLIPRRDAATGGRFSSTAWPWRCGGVPRG